MWAFRKGSLLKRLRFELLLDPIRRSLKTKTIVFILDELIENNRSDLLKLIGDDNLTFNPLNNLPLMLYIVDNWKILNNFPEHKRLIKKIIKT